MCRQVEATYDGQTATTPPTEVPFGTCEHKPKFNYWVWCQGTPPCLRPTHKFAGCERGDSGWSSRNPYRQTEYYCCRFLCCRKQLDAIVKDIRAAEVRAGVKPGQKAGPSYEEIPRWTHELRVLAHKFRNAHAAHLTCLTKIGQEGGGIINDWRQAGMTDKTEISYDAQVAYLEAARKHETSLDIDHWMQANASDIWEERL